MNQIVATLLSGVGEGRKLKYMKGKRGRRREGRQKPVWTVKAWGVGGLGMREKSVKQQQVEPCAVQKALGGLVNARFQ